MIKYIAILALTLAVSACTLQKNPTPSTTVSSEIPADAKVMSGYGYPAVPLDQYNKNSTQSGSNPL
jgi:hypothetical protein